MEKLSYSASEDFSEHTSQLSSVLGGVLSPRARKYALTKG